MRRAVEILAFAFLAAGLLIAAAAVVASRSGPWTGGQADAQMSVLLAAVPPSVSRQLAAWDARPEAHMLDSALPVPAPSLAPGLVSDAEAIPRRTSQGARPRFAAADSPASLTVAPPARPMLVQEIEVVRAVNVGASPSSSPAAAAAPPDVSQNAPRRLAALPGIAPGRPYVGGPVEREDDLVDRVVQRVLLGVWRTDVLDELERKISAVPGPPVDAGLRLTVSDDGKLLDLEVTGSSGDLKRDDAAVAAIREIDLFPAAPDGLTVDKLTLDFPRPSAD